MDCVVHVVPNVYASTRSKVLRSKSSLAVPHIILNLPRGREPRPLGELLDLFAFEAACTKVHCFEHEHRSDIPFEAV